MMWQRERETISDPSDPALGQYRTTLVTLKATCSDQMTRITKAPSKNKDFHQFATCDLTAILLGGIFFNVM